MGSSGQLLLFFNFITISIVHTRYIEAIGEGIYNQTEKVSSILKNSVRLREIGFYNMKNSRKKSLKPHFKCTGGF